jgi:hypothetical protein
MEGKGSKPVVIHLLEKPVPTVIIVLLVENFG